MLKRPAPRRPAPPWPRPEPRRSRLASDEGCSVWTSAKFTRWWPLLASSRAESRTGAAPVDEVVFGWAAVRSILTAVRIKMRSLQTIGDALPRPGMATFHLMFFLVDHSVGGFPLGATPFACGPRH